MSFLHALIVAQRPHQWSKNLLVFASLLIARNFSDIPVLIDTFLCFVAFCLVSSAGYLINDIIDRDDDRNHPVKKLRPIASGVLRIRHVLPVATVNLILGLLLAASLNLPVLLATSAYVLFNAVYTYWAKRKILLDTIFLAGLFTIRIIAGVAVTGELPSFWLLAFSMFVFASLAMLKRYTEIDQRPVEQLVSHSTRAYIPDDKIMLAIMGIANGFLSILVLAFYLNSDDVVIVFTTPVLLWFICPLFMYWIGRIWMLAARGFVRDDPVLFALKDGVTLVVAGLSVGIMLVAA